MTIINVPGLNKSKSAQKSLCGRIFMYILLIYDNGFYSFSYLPGIIV